MRNPVELFRFHVEDLDDRDHLLNRERIEVWADSLEEAVAVAEDAFPGWRIRAITSGGAR